MSELLTGDPEELRARLEAGLLKQKAGQDMVIEMMQTGENHLISFQSGFAMMQRNDYSQPELDQLLLYVDAFIVRADRLALESERLRDRAIEIKESLAGPDVTEDQE